MLGTPPPWPLGLVTAVLAGVLLWSVTARLRLRPESRAASTAVYACCALLTELTTVDGVDGRATLLLAAGGMFAVAGARRSALAALACVGAVALAPVVGVGVLVLLGAMALRKDLLTRFPAALRRLTGVAAFAAAAGVAALLARPQDGPAVPVGVLVVLGACALLIGGVSWVRLPWLRPPVAAVVALVACQLVPGPDLDAVLPAAAGLAVLAAVLTEEHHVLLARPVLVGAVMAGVVATALLVPAIPLPAAPDVRSRTQPGGGGRPGTRARRTPDHRGLDRDPSPGAVRARWTSSASPTTASCSRPTTPRGPAGTPAAWCPATSARRSSAGTSTRGAGPGCSSRSARCAATTWSRSRDRTAGSPGSP